MTTSDVIKYLDEVASVIVANRNALASAKEAIGKRAVNLAALPTTYAELVSTINGFTGADVFEEQTSSTLSRLVTEYQSLQSEAEAAVTALETYSEF